MLFNICDLFCGLLLAYREINEQIALRRLDIVDIHAFDYRHIRAGIGAFYKRSALGLGKNEVASCINDADVVHVHIVYLAVVKIVLCGVKKQANPQNPFRGQQVLTLIGPEQTTSSLVVMIC